MKNGSTKHNIRYNSGIDLIEYGDGDQQLITSSELRRVRLPFSSFSHIHSSLSVAEISIALTIPAVIVSVTIKNLLLLFFHRSTINNRHLQREMYISCARKTHSATQRAKRCWLVRFSLSLPHFAYLPVGKTCLMWSSRYNCVWSALFPLLHFSSVFFPSFSALGRVSHFHRITAISFTIASFAVGRGSSFVGTKCTRGNSGNENMNYSHDLPPPIANFVIFSFTPYNNRTTLYKYMHISSSKQIFLLSYNCCCCCRCTFTIWSLLSSLVVDKKFNLSFPDLFDARAS